MKEKEYIFVGTAQLKTRDYINDLEKTNRKLEANRKELKKWLERIIKNLEESQTLRFNHSVDFELKSYKRVLDKMQELESGNNECN